MLILQNILSIMKFRVAIFKRRARRLVFDKFAFNGYRIGQDGTLYRGNKQCNTTDRRARMFYEINFMLEKKDRLGSPIYDHDIIFDARFSALCTVIWSESNGAFAESHKQNGFKTTFRYCDFRTDAVEVIGNEYERCIRQIVAWCPK